MAVDGWASTRSASRRTALPYRAAALLVWPRLDRARLRRCGDDPHRIVRLVERRTGAGPEAILAMLEKAAEGLQAHAHHMSVVAAPAVANPVVAAPAAPTDRRPVARPGTTAPGRAGDEDDRVAV
jgi:hypothetical protein